MTARILPNSNKSSRESEGSATKQGTATIQIVIMVLALLVRAVTLLALASKPLGGDSASYHKVALQILSGARYYPLWPPGLPYYLALFHAPFGPSEVVARIAVFVLFIPFLFLLRKLLNELVSTRFATLGLAILAIYPVFIEYAMDPLTQLPVGFLILVAVYCVNRLLQQRSIGVALLLGASLGAMVLFRSSSMLLLLAIPLFLSAKIRSIKFPAIALATAALLIGAWLLQAESLAGEFVWINGTNDQNFYLGNSPFTPQYRTWWMGSHGGEGLPDSARYETIRDSVTRLGYHNASIYYREAALRYIREYPGRFIERTFNRVATFFVFDSFTSSYAKFVGSPVWVVLLVLLVDCCCYLFVATLTLALLIFYYREVRERPLFQMMYGVILLYAIPYCISFSSSVYHTPLLGIYILAAMLFLDRSPISAWREHWRRRFTQKQKWLFIGAMVYFAFMQIQFVLNMASRF